MNRRTEIYLNVTSRLSHLIVIEKPSDSVSNREVFVKETKMIHCLGPDGQEERSSNRYVTHSVENIEDGFPHRRIGTSRLSTTPKHKDSPPVSNVFLLPCIFVGCRLSIEES